MPGCTDNQRRHLLFEGDLKLKEGSTKVRKHKKHLLTKVGLTGICTYIQSFGFYINLLTRKHRK